MHHKLLSSRLIQQYNRDQDTKPCSISRSSSSSSNSSNSSGSNRDTASPKAPNKPRSQKQAGPETGPRSCHKADETTPKATDTPPVVDHVPLSLSLSAIVSHELGSAESDEPEPEDSKKSTREAKVAKNAKRDQQDKHADAGSTSTCTTASSTMSGSAPQDSQVSQREVNKRKKSKQANEQRKRQRVKKQEDERRKRSEDVEEDAKMQEPQAREVKRPSVTRKSPQVADHTLQQQAPSKSPSLASARINLPSNIPSSSVTAMAARSELAAAEAVHAAQLSSLSANSALSNLDDATLAALAQQIQQRLQQQQQPLSSALQHQHLALQAERYRQLQHQLVLPSSAHRNLYLYPPAPSASAPSSFLEQYFPPLLARNILVNNPTNSNSSFLNSIHSASHHRSSSPSGSVSTNPSQQHANQPLSATGAAVSSAISQFLQQAGATQRPNVPKQATENGGSTTSSSERTELNVSTSSNRNKISIAERNGNRHADEALDEEVSGEEDDDDISKGEGSGSGCAIGRRFRPYQSEQWTEKFQELCDFRRAKGHCQVPHTYAENPPLARWVKRQRYQYKLKMEEKPSTMTDQRIQALENIGFIWDSHAAAWAEKLHELMDYTKKRGNCNVPSTFPENPQLATWVKCQRRQYKLMRDGKTSNMTLERIVQLEKIGFVWEVRKK